MSISKTIRNTAVSVVVLAVLCAGAGVGYTYFFGSDADQTSAAFAKPVTNTAQPVAQVRKPAPNAKESASIETLTSPVAQGENAAVNVKTNPQSKCTITVAYGTVISKDSGLAPKAADEYGVVTWTWTVDKTAAVGKWPVTVTCVYNGRSAVVQGDLMVQTALQAAADAANGQ